MAWGESVLLIYFIRRSDFQFFPPPKIFVSQDNSIFRTAAVTSFNGDRIKIHNCSIRMKINSGPKFPSFPLANMYFYKFTEQLNILYKCWLLLAHCCVLFSVTKVFCQPWRQSRNSIKGKINRDINSGTFAQIIFSLVFSYPTDANPFRVW